MADDDENLSAEQTEKLICFQAISQLESLDRNKQILKQFSWNVEAAVQSLFDEDEQTNQSSANNLSNNSQSSSLSSLNSTGANTSTNIQNEFNERTQIHFNGPLTPTLTRTANASNVQRMSRLTHQPLPNINVFTQRTLNYYGPRDQPVVPVGFFQWSMFIVAFPFKMIFSTLIDIANAFWGMFETSAIPVEYDPLANIAEFAIQYNSKFGTNHIDFFQGSYTEAVNEAKRELKFLVVYLHQNDDQDSSRFASETMINPDLIEYLRSNTIVWACSKDLPEGRKVYNALRAKRCPFLGVIVYKNARMTLISKIEGPVSAAELMLQLSQLISENEAELVIARMDKEERNQTQLIRKEQDQAYEESLKIDREKARVKKEKEDALKEAERLEQQKIVDELAKEKELMNKRIELRKILAETSEPDASDPASIKLLIKLPSGSRHQRIFLRIDPLSELYKFVFSQEECPNSFEIAINFPHKVVECTETTTQSIQDFGINQSMLLFVNDLDA